MLVLVLVLVSFAVCQTNIAQVAAPSQSATISIAPPFRAVGPERQLLIPSRPSMAAGRKIVESGTGVARPAARTLEVVATGYAKGDGSGETTFTGTQVHWGVVAVDPRFIPLGSKIKVSLSENQGIPLAAKVSSTTFTAEDTGRLIKGDHLDIWFPKLQMALDWGVRRVTIAVIPPKTGSAPS